jgi:membrane-bound serine protease (ClpP class)
MTVLKSFFIAWVLCVFTGALAAPSAAKALSPATAPTPVTAQAPGPVANCTTEIEITGAIGPATLDWLSRGLEKAKADGCGAVLLTLNTPGGNLQTTRLIVEKILNYDRPILCLVSPSGAHAGSAGAIILQACHVSGALAATNLGAATPVSGDGQAMPDDLRNKMINDTRSWVESLAKLRGRSLTFAKDIIEKAKAVSAEEAFRLKAIEWVGEKKSDFLTFANGRKVKLSENIEATVATGEVVVLPVDLRYKVMDFVMNPQFAYLIFMGSLGLLYFELTHPGMIAPGVIGALGLATSLMSLHMLDVTTGGLLLILLGVLLMILEAFVTSFGVLGFGGVVSFFLGSLFLFDPLTSGYQLPLGLILPTTLVLGALMFGIAYLALSTRRRTKQSDFSVLEGREAVVCFLDSDKEGQVEINGEIWGFRAENPVALQDKVVVVKHEGLTLIVKAKGGKST